MEEEKSTSFSNLKVAHPSGTNLQLAAETCDFSQDPSLSMGIMHKADTTDGEVTNRAHRMRESPPFIIAQLHLIRISCIHFDPLPTAVKAA